MGKAAFETTTLMIHRIMAAISAGVKLVTVKPFTK